MPPNANIRAVVLLADYIAQDVSGKLNALGVGFSMTGLQPTGATAPQYVAAIIDLPSSYAGDNVAIAIELRDETTDSVVTVPDDSGAQQALRVQQLLLAQRPTVPGVHVPTDMPCRIQAVLGFPMGLPLTAGHKYAWKLEVDGTRLKGWAATFYVPAPPSGPIVGGPVGPADIPNVSTPVIEQDDEAEQ